MTAIANEVAKELGKPLDANRVKSREGSRGGSLSYIETHDAIRTANSIFGFGGWGHEVVELRQLDGVTVQGRDNKAGYQVGYICIVRLTVDGCVATSGVGYGDAVEYRASAPVTAHELAAKEAESDALKRALKNYGDQFGLALYDKAAAQNGHLDYSASTASAAVAGETVTEPAKRPPASPTSNGAAPTEKQVGFLRKLLTDGGYTPADLGVSIEELTKQQASQFIEALKGGTFVKAGEEVRVGYSDPDEIPFAPTLDGWGL